MSREKTIERISSSRMTTEGAGVGLHRAFGYNEIPGFDPFLMLDDFRAGHPKDYLAGFPWHPHRGIETVTYMLDGRVEHGDSMGHSGTVDAGGVQWMTAGSSIIHQEMPKPVDGRMGGFQLWVNLPRKYKMMAPRYQEIREENIPAVDLEVGARAKVICGTVAGVSGPVQDLVAEPLYLDVSLQPGARVSLPVRPGYMSAAYVFGGTGWFDRQHAAEQGNRALLLFGNHGDEVGVRAVDSGVRFLFISGKPLREPIAWGGPIVMNTQQELEQAFTEYENGTFIRKGA